MKKLSTLLFCLTALAFLYFCWARQDGQLLYMNEIWAIEDTTEFCAVLDERLAKRSRQGEKLQRLSQEERAFYLIGQTEREVGSVGFAQYLRGAGGNSTYETLYALTMIGAEETATIYLHAITAYGAELPADREERVAILTQHETEAILATLAECDGEFSACTEDLSALRHAYALANKDAFS